MLSQPLEMVGGDRSAEGLPTKAIAVFAGAAKLCWIIPR